MRLNDAGRMALSEWEALPRRFPTIDLDAFVIMPNHVHGIIVITQTPIGATTGATTRVAPTVGDVVGAFKSITTVLYTRGVKQSGWPPFVGRLWQRNDYEHIIRDERELERIREYILNNPANWATDEDSIAVSPASGPQGGRAARRDEVRIDDIETKAGRNARRLRAGTRDYRLGAEGQARLAQSAVPGEGYFGIRSNERVWSKPAVSDGQKPIAFPIKRRRFPLVRSAWGANRPFPTTLRWTLLPAG